MLGRVRTCSLSSLEVLEIERTPSKLLKDDSLSIYEKTLLKLQQGSQLNLSSIPQESMNTNTSPSMATLTSDEASMSVTGPDYASTDFFPNSGDTQSTIISKEEQQRNLSVLYMFSRYKTSKNNNKIASYDSSMAMEDDCSSANVSPNHDPELQLGCIVDPPSLTLL